MKTLDEAWAWYNDSRHLLRLMKRVADQYWPNLPWDEMGKDDLFKAVEDTYVVRAADAVLAEFDDVAVFVLFSVFEANVRDQLLSEVSVEAGRIDHAALKRAATALKNDIEEGSFYNNVLDLYKGLDHDLVEQVNQVRVYRNWVAHGR